MTRLKFYDIIYIVKKGESYADAGRWLIANNYSKDKRYNRVAGKIIMCCNQERKTAYTFKWKKNIEEK